MTPYSGPIVATRIYVVKAELAEALCGLFDISQLKDDGKEHKECRGTHTLYPGIHSESNTVGLGISINTTEGRFCFLPAEDETGAVFIPTISWAEENGLWVINIRHYESGVGYLMTHIRPHPTA